MAKAKLTTRQRTSKKINRKRAVRKWWQTATRRLAIALVVIFASGAVFSSWWFWHSGRFDQAVQNGANRFWAQTAKAGFRIEDVYLEGRHFTPLVDINTAMGIHIGDPILALSLSDMRARLQAIPRVHYAEVSRVLPGQLHVHIIEREPVAVWQNQGKLHLIDQDGVVMEYVDPVAYRQLPLVVGEDAPAHTQELLTALVSEPAMAKNVSAAVRVGERRWNICFTNGLVLKLPEEKMAEAWHQFAHVAAEDRLMERAITAVDMRLSDRIFIKLKPQETKPAKTGGSET